MDEAMKKCTRCHKDIALSGYKPNSRNTDGFNKYCNICVDKRNRANHRWREKHPEESRERLRRWREKNPEKNREIARRYYAKNPEKLRERQQKLRAENPGKASACSRRWREKNPEKSYEVSCSYRAKKELEIYQSGVDDTLTQLAGIVDQKILDSLKGGAQDGRD